MGIRVLSAPTQSPDPPSNPSTTGPEAYPHIHHGSPPAPSASANPGEALFWGPKSGFGVLRGLGVRVWVWGSLSLK